jgi:flagellar protein FlaF
MNNTYLAKQGYKTVQKEAASDKAIELRVFMSVTAQLKSVDFENKLEFPKLCDAVLENLQLWKILFLDLVNPSNTLPQELKTSLIQLSDFTMSHSRKVLLGEASPEALIDINSSIIAGLRQSMTPGSSATKTKLAEVA